MLEAANAIKTQYLYVRREASALWKLLSLRDEEALHMQLMEAGLEMSTSLTLKIHSFWHASIVSQRKSSQMLNKS